MKPLAALVIALLLSPAWAQPGPQGGPQGPRFMHRPMPPPERRMSWEERQRLREQVQSGQMTRDEARQRWREERERRGMEPGRYHQEQRERLRRDVLEANRDLEKR